MTSSSDGCRGLDAEVGRRRHSVGESADDEDAGGGTSRSATAAPNPTCLPDASTAGPEVAPVLVSLQTPERPTGPEVTTEVAAEPAAEPAPKLAAEPASTPASPAAQTSATHSSLATPVVGYSLVPTARESLGASGSDIPVPVSTPLAVKSAATNNHDHDYDPPVPPPAPASCSSEADEHVADTPSTLSSQLQSTQNLAEQASHSGQQQVQLQTRAINPSTSAATSMTDPFASSAPFSASTMVNMILAMSHMNASAALSPPPTVMPYEVTLSRPSDDSLNGSGPANALHQAVGDTNLESFARLEFADSVFQMTTYAVIIGRDQRALNQARLDEKRAEEIKRRAEENATMGIPLPSSIKRDRSKFSKSYVSEEGGMLGPESESEDDGRPTKRRKPSINASSQRESDESQENIISNRQYISHTPGAAAVDLRALRTSPYYIPFIGIHSPGPNIAMKTKAISRNHLKISYNKKDCVFEAIPMHENGFFCEDVHYKSGTVVLRCGNRLQIKDVDFRFIINGVEKGCTGAEEFVEDEAAKKRQSRGGKEMSFDFERSHGNREIQDTSDELSELDTSPPELSDFGEDAIGRNLEAGKPQPRADDEARGLAGHIVAGVEMEGHLTEIRAELVPDHSFVIPQIPKNRGPGRPPKNGIMSKREQRLLKKQQQEMAKKTEPQPPVAEPPVKRKVGRPRKHPLAENGQDRTERRKYKPRKPKNEDGAGGSDAERRAREKKEKKARVKSPPPNFNIDDFTEEQLQKPVKNYSVLIDEALTAAGPPGLTLKQIYNRICTRYPWYFFFAETRGWESSVRHNLIGNEAFKKDEQTGLWYRIPGVELDAGKKRKAPSPDHILSAQGHGPNAFPLFPGQAMPVPGTSGYPPGQIAPVGYHMPGFAEQPGRSAQPMQQHVAAGQGPRPGAVQPPHLPGYGSLPVPALAPLVGSQVGTYNSPYASQPPPPAKAPVKAEGKAPAPAGTSAVLPPPPPPAPVALPASLSSQRPSATTALLSSARTAARSTSRRKSTAAGPRLAPPPLGTPLKPVIEPGLLTLIIDVKKSLILSLEKTNNPKSQAIIISALNLYIGLKKGVTEDEKTVHTLIKGIARVVQAYYSKQNSPTPAATSVFAEAPLPPIICDTNVLGLLIGFKNASIKTLKEWLSEDQAEMITLSAIDRVLGLTMTSIVPRPAQDEPMVINCEGYEQGLMGSLRTLLTNMQQK